MLNKRTMNCLSISPLMELEEETEEEPEEEVKKKRIALLLTCILIENGVKP